MTRKLIIDRAYSETVDRRISGNSNCKKLGVHWLNEVQFFNQTFEQVESFVVRNRQFHIATKRDSFFNPDK